MGSAHLFRGDVLIYSCYKYGAGYSSKLANDGDMLLYGYQTEWTLFRWCGSWNGPIDTPELLKRYKTLVLLQAHPEEQS